MSPQRSTIVWALLCRVFGSVVWTLEGCSASLTPLGTTDLETFQYDYDYAKIGEQELRGALDDCVAGDHP